MRYERQCVAIVRDRGLARVGTGGCYGFKLMGPHLENTDG